MEVMLGWRVPVHRSASLPGEKPMSLLSSRIRGFSSARSEQGQGGLCEQKGYSCGLRCSRYGQAGAQEPFSLSAGICSAAPRKGPRG